MSESEPTDVQETPATPPQAPQATEAARERPEATPEPTEPDEATGGNAEAAKWRVKLREAETERDNLTSQLEAARRQIVTQAAGLGNAAPLLFDGRDVGEFFTDDGSLDAGKVDEAAREVRDKYGLPNRPKPDPNQGRIVTAAPTPAFVEAFKPKTR